MDFLPFLFYILQNLDNPLSSIFTSDNIETKCSGFNVSFSTNNANPSLYTYKCYI